MEPEFTNLALTYKGKPWLVPIFLIFLANTMNPWKLLKDQIVIGKKIDETFYAAALDEFLSGKLRAGLMAKAIAQSDGNEQRAKGVYIRLLADAIRDDHYLVHRSNEESLRIQQQADEKIKQELARRSDQAQAKKKGGGGWIGLIILLLFAPAWLPELAALLLLSHEKSAPTVAASFPVKTRNTYAPSSYDKLVASYERHYPQINPDSPHFDKHLTDQIANRMSIYRKNGHSADEALKLAVRDFFPRNALQSKISDSYNAPQSQSLDAYSSSRGCEYKPVMTDEDYRRCGITPPGAR